MRSSKIKITAFLRRDAMINAAFLRAIGRIAVSYNLLNPFMQRKGQDGAGITVYARSYRFFEKLVSLPFRDSTLYLLVDIDICSVGVDQISFLTLLCTSPQRFLEGAPRKRSEIPWWLSAEDTFSILI